MTPKHPSKSSSPIQANATSWRRRLQIGIPLAVSAGLVTLAIVLTLRIWQTDETQRPAFVIPETETPQVPEPPNSGSPDHHATSESESIADVSDTLEISRWNIHPLPEGWDPEVAAGIEKLAVILDVDIAFPDRLRAAQKARDDLIAMLQELGPEALPTLEAILNAESLFVTRRHILLRIGDFGPESEEATFALFKFYKKIHADPKARSELNYVIKAMGKLQNENSLSMLSDMIAADNVSENDRSRFISALGDHPRAEERTELFVDNMVNGQDNHVRNLSAQAIGKLAERRREENVSSGEFLPDLMDAYEGSSRIFVRQTVLGSIGKVGDPSSLSFLEEIARLTPDREIRLSAANAVRRIGQHSGSRRAWAILDGLVQTESDAAVRTRMHRWSNESSR